MGLIQEQVEAGTTKDLVEGAIRDIKTMLANTIPTMQLADISMWLKQ